MSAAEIAREPGSRLPTQIDIEVGEIIRKRRQDANMTLGEMGAELGISHQQLQKYETGTNRLSAGMLWQVAIVLRCSIEELFPGSDTREDLPRKLREAERQLTEIRRIVNGGKR